MSEEVESVKPVKPSNAATAVEAASVRVNSRFVIPQKPISGINTSKQPPPRPKISSSTPVIMAPRTNGKQFNVATFFASLKPKSGGKRTKKRSKKAKKTRKH